MPDSGLDQITITRVVPAEKWRVIRLVTKVEDFPEYIPSIKEVSILEKTRHMMKTKWRVEIDKIPITWTEEDSLILKYNAICFRIIEGDLSEFKGEWVFKNHPGGTEVTINVFFRVDIPAIKDLMSHYLKKMITRNFEAILDGIERRLVSIRYKSFREGNAEKIAGFGVIGHFYNFVHLEKCLHMLNPEMKLPSREFLSQLFNITPSFKLYDVSDFKSKTGETIRGCFIVATFIPDMIEKDIWAIFSKVVRACKIAEKSGMGIVTLGGFTSIVAERIGKQISEEVDIAVTTGNTFAAVMAIDGTLKAVNMLGIDLRQSKAAIIGGTGDIGSACARALVNKVKHLTITGRTKTNLRDVRTELARMRGAEVLATTDNQAAVRDADIVITAAAAPASILNIDWFKPGSVICDVGYPKNVSYAQTTREDILIFSGGLAKTPTPVTFPVDTGLPSTSAVYGSFAEAIILALEKRYENFSFGRGHITLDKMDEIRQMGKKHGFEVSDFYWADKFINPKIAEKVNKI